MKKVIILLALAALTSCKKESIVVLPGQRYDVKGHYYIFNKGAMVPFDQVLCTSTYVAYDGENRAHCLARTDWARVAKKSGDGVKQATVDGTMATLTNSGQAWGDTTTRDWDIPQYDLKLR